MSRKFNCVMALCALIMVYSSNMALAQGGSLTLCGVVDNSPQDLNPLLGIVQVNCNLGTGTFAGSATETQHANYDSINVEGSFKGSGTLLVSNNYNLGNWVGHGYEWVRLNGTLNDPTGLTTGQTSLLGQASATTFSNNAATSLALSHEPPPVEG